MWEQRWRPPPPTSTAIRNSTPALSRADDGSAIGTATAVSAVTAPVRATQVAATDGIDMFISAQCPDDLGQDRPSGHPDAWTCIYRAASGKKPVVLTKAPPLTQNLSYSRFSGRLWGLNERINTTQGVRTVFSIKVPAAARR
ncbi:hypothetical protein [Couchioplanes caeruleus]|uniref:Uncharacterized protein n=2 Tax=Couchioplanes caeruleus TaxID=56438 RepID=A0A1K0FR01_9ACTN|nr:hypothetical protein [Couchioplanes caeruleus]OJF15263.1 hypothetical protein BG844_05195 [Couchioplanes caeruleus subsp. caeruleus]ROP30777.1 hypothetical protein EDD30_3641 [Couchioplanes caeruleus]